MFIAPLFLAVSQLPQDRDPIEASKLRKGEVVRIYKVGGRTPTGLYRSLVVLRSDGSAIVKTADASGEITAPAELVIDIKKGIASTSATALTATPRASEVPPTASDGMDVYLSFKKNGRPHHWTNTKYEAPEGFFLVEQMDQILNLFTRSRLNHRVPPRR